MTAGQERTRLSLDQEKGGTCFSLGGKLAVLALMVVMMVMLTMRDEGGVL